MNRAMVVGAAEKADLTPEVPTSFSSGTDDGVPMAIDHGRGVFAGGTLMATASLKRPQGESAYFARSALCHESCRAITAHKNHGNVGTIQARRSLDQRPGLTSATKNVAVQIDEDQ